MDLCELEPMTQRNPAKATIKVDPELVRKAKQTCALLDTKIQDYIDNLLRGPIERDHAKAIRKIREGAEGGK